MVAPIFLLVLAGIIEFGHAFRVQHMLSNAARRGARSAITPSASTSQVVDKVKSQCSRTMNVSGTDLTVEIAVNSSIGADLSQAGRGDEIDVTVSVPYSKAASGFFANLFSSSVLSATCTLEHE